MSQKSPNQVNEPVAAPFDDLEDPDDGCLGGSEDDDDQTCPEVKGAVGYSIAAGDHLTTKPSSPQPSGAGVDIDTNSVDIDDNDEAGEEGTCSGEYDLGKDDTDSVERSTLGQGATGEVDLDEDDTDSVERCTAGQESTGDVNLAEDDTNSVERSTFGQGATGEVDLDEDDTDSVERCTAGQESTDEVDLGDDDNWEPCARLCEQCLRIQTALAAGLGQVLAGENEDSPLFTFDMIHISTVLGHCECVASCIDSGMDVDKMTDLFEYNALLLACGTRRLDVVQLLINYDADVNAENISGSTALLMAVTNNDLECIRLLVEAGANVNYLPSRGDVRRDPLMIAVFGGFIDCIKLLLSHGAKFNLDDKEYNWDIFCARRVYETFASGILEEIIMLMLKEEGCLKSALFSCVIDSNNEGELLRRLLDQDITLKFHGEKMQRLTECGEFLLIHNDNLDSLEVILQHMDKSKMNMESLCIGMTALQWACHRTGRPEVVHMLLSHGADTEAYVDYHGTSIFYCIEAMCDHQSALHAALWLIRFNCDLKRTTRKAVLFDQQTEVNITPMDLALASYNLYMAQVLMLAGVQKFLPSVCSIDYITPLPNALKCTELQRDDFIKRHLRTPTSLYVLARASLRKALGPNSDSKVDSLGLSARVEKFVKYSDLDLIASRFKLAYESMPPED